MKKLMLIVSGLVVAGTLAFFLLNRTTQQSSLSGNEATLAAMDEAVTPSSKTKEYIDSSGFTFSYPDDLTIETKEVDKTAYSNLELTADDVEGLISIQVADTMAASVDAIIKKNKDLSATAVKKVTLAGLDARQYKLNDQFITLALDNGVLFTLIAHIQENEPYWQLVYAKIIETFAFTPAPPVDTSATTGGGEEEVIFEGEEIIE
jgi:hypothetical protein